MLEGIDIIVRDVNSTGSKLVDVFALSGETIEFALLLQAEKLELDPFD